MMIPPSFVCRQDARRRLKVAQGGFSILEILVVVGIMTVMIGLVLGSSGAINGSQGMTAVQQVTAMCDLARARSMRGEGTVLLAFSTGKGSLTSEPFRSAILCAEDLSTEEADDYIAISEWFHLPAGYVFTNISAANLSAGVNVFSDPEALRMVTLPGSVEKVELPCVGFGSLGEIVFPEPDSAAQESLLVAVAEGTAGTDGPRSRFGGVHVPEDCRWIALRRNSGAPMILP